jgi:predicted ATPase
LLPEQVQHLPELASLPPLSSLDPEQEQRRLFAALADVFTRAASSRPMLLVVEDLHWCDESTLEFLLFLARKTVASRLLLLLTYRGEEVGQSLRSFLAQLDREHLRQDIALVPLTRAHTGTMLRTILLGAASLPAGLLDALYGLTEGNPFFLEEVLKTVLMAEELVKVDDGWHLAHSTQSAGRGRTAPRSRECGRPTGFATRGGGGTPLRFCPPPTDHAAR